MKVCSKCKEEKSKSDFYIKIKKTGQLQAYCKPCLLNSQMYRWKDRKEKAIKLMGGKCEDCGIEGRPEIYQFHHLDPSIKEHSWDRLRMLKWETILSEISSCALLCANCHIVRHSKTKDTYL